MDNILINFAAGDQSGLTESANGLDKIIQKEGQVGEAWQKTSEQMTAQNNTIIGQTSKLAKSIDDLGVAAKSMDKVAIGGAYANYLKQIQQQLGLTSNELINYVQNARKAAQAAILDPSATDEQVKQLTLSLQVINDQLKQFGVNEDSTGLKSKNFTSQIRAVRNELLAMTEAGQSGTAEFDALKNKYAEMQRISRQFMIESQGLVQNNEAIAGTISILSGVTAGYQVATGAAVLFGDANSDVQKAMQKLFAAMNLLQGLQQIEAVIQKSSAASILLESIFRKANTEAITEGVVATTADTEASLADAAAKGVEAGATAGATVAAEGLNAALLANPVTAVIVGITALIVALSTLTDNSAAVAAMQDNFNKSLEETGVIVKDDIAIFDRYAERQLAFAKTQGASTLELISLEGKLNNEKLATIKKAADAATAAYKKQKGEINQLLAQDIEVDKSIYKAHDDLLKNKETLDKEYTDLYQKQVLLRQQFEQQANADNIKSYNSYVQLQVAAQIAGTDAERNAQIASIKEIAAVRESDPSFKALTAGEKALARANDEKQIQALELQNYQHYLRGRVDLYDAYIAESKIQILKNETDSIDAINHITDLQIAALKKQQKEALSNPTLNAGEQEKIIQESNLKIAELEKQKQTLILTIQKSGINAQLVLAQNGSIEQYKLKVDQIDNEQKLALSAAQLTQQQIDEINNTATKKRQDAERAFNQFQLQQEISRDNAALGKFGLDEDTKLELTLKRLNDEKAVEISQAEENAAKIHEIDVKYDNLTRAAKIASIDAIKNKELAAYQAYHDEVINLDKQIAADTNIDTKFRISALEDYKREQEGELQIEFDTLEKKKGLIEDYDVQYQILLNKKKAFAQTIEQQITAIEKKEIDQRVSDMQAVFNIFKTGFQSFLPQDAFSNALSSLNDFGNQAFKIFSNLKQQVADYNRIIFDPGSSAGEVLKAAADKQQVESDARKAAEVAAVQAAQSTINQIYADASAQRQQHMQDEVKALEDQKNKELQNTNLTKQQQANIEARYAQKEKQVKLEAWKADQKAKEQQAIINGLLAITATFAEFGWPAGIIPAAIQAAATAIIVGEIAGQSPPKFKHGKVDIQGPGTNTSDSIPALISKGESVIKADSTAKWKEALTAINNDQFEHYLMAKVKDFVFPHIPEDVNPSIPAESIDYKKLASEIASQMKGVIPGSKSMHFNIDKDGIHTLVMEGNTQTEFKNNRYSMT